MVPSHARPFLLAAALLIALSVPGVRVAHASDLAPTARELLKQPRAAAPVAAASQSCDVGSQIEQGSARQQAQIAALQRRILAEGAGEARVLNGRGVGYGARPNPALEMQRIHAEAAALRAEPQ